MCGVESKLRDLGTADRETWGALYSEIVVARALAEGPAIEVLAFDPPADSGRRADLLLAIGDDEVIVEVCAPRPPDVSPAGYPSRLMEALKRVDVAVEIEVLGCDRLESHDELPDVHDAVARYRRAIGGAEVGQEIHLGGPVRVRLVARRIAGTSSGDSRRRS